MHSKIILPVLQQADVILVAVAIISILFFFFYVKVKFQKTASSKSYGILFYSFVFYSIAAISFVLLNAMDRLFKFNNDLYAGYVWFFPLSFLSAIFGAICGWLIYFAASKVAEPYAYKLLNLSLIVIAPTLAYTLLIKPFNDNLAILTPTSIAIPEAALNNTLAYTTLQKKPDQIFIPATPAAYHDTLDISIQDAHTIRIQNKKNGFMYTYHLPAIKIDIIYVADLQQHSLLALLALSHPLQKQATLLVFDKLGDCIFTQSFDDYPNRLSRSDNGKYLLLQKELSPDSLLFKTCMLLN